jgi:hypothetical protein
MDSNLTLFSPQEEQEFREAERQGTLPKEINRFGDH